MMFFGRPIYTKYLFDFQTSENDPRKTVSPSRSLPYLCTSMRRIAFTLLSLCCFTSLPAQIFVLDAGRNGNLPARLDNEIGLAAASDESDEANGNWQLWMDSAAQPVRSSALALGFSFRHGTTVYTHVRAGSNGYITFDTTAPLFSDTLNRSLPVSGLPTPAFVFGGLQLSGSNDKLLFRYTGTAPNRSLWIKWHSASAGENFAYAAAVIREEGTCWMGWMHSGNNGQPYKKPTLYLGMQTASANAAFPGNVPLQPDSAATGLQAGDNHFACFVFDTAYRSDIRWLARPAALQFERNTPRIWNLPAFSAAPTASGDLVLAVAVNGGAEFQRRIANPFGAGRVAAVQDTLPGLNDTGFYNVRVRILSYAGIAETLRNGDTLSFTAAVHNPLPYNKRPLVEYHTASWCAECPGMHPWLSQASGRGAVVLEHHQRDGMTHAHTNSIGASNLPALFMGGSMLESRDTAGLNAALAIAQAEKSPYRLQIADAALSATGQLSYRVEMTCGAHFAGEVKLLTGLREKFQRGLGQPWEQRIAGNLRNDTLGGPFIGFPANVEMYFHPNVAWRFMSPYQGENSGLSASQHRPGFAVTRNFSTPLPDPVFANVPVTSVYSDRGTNVVARYKPYETEIFAVLWTQDAAGRRIALQSVVQPLWDFAAGKTELHKPDLQAWPNPSNGQFTVRHSGLRVGAPFAVYAASGACVMKGSLAAEETQITLPAIAPGVYWFRSEGRAVSLVIAP